jgi:diguanylate cyclase (GGDEF)-like protein
MISLLALSLVFSGALILIRAMVPIRQLIGKLSSGPVRTRWHLMAALIALFFIGYLGYAAAFWESHSTVIDLIVPSVFFFGACFVLLTTTLSLRTAIDMGRLRVLERDAATDPLTGIFNRRYMNCRLTEEVANAKRYGLPLSVLMLDIDHFKQINDKHGHQAGDEMLVTLGKIISGELRESDVLTRYGGEEFLVIATHTPLMAAANVAERVRKCIESHDFSLPKELGGLCGIRMTVSIGVAAIDGEATDRDALVYAADENLYHAKREGRNRVCAGTCLTAS